MSEQEIVKLATETALKLLEDKSNGILSDIMKKLAAEAAKAGAEAIERETRAIAARQQQKIKDRRLRNTRLLLKNYRAFKAHVELAVSDLDDLDTDDMRPGEIFEILSRGYSSEQAYVDAIRRTAGRTAIMVGHLERMLRLYENLCAASAFESEKRRWRILQARYLDENPLPMDEIADNEHIHKRTAERDLDAAIESLSALIFGIDGIR